MTGNLIKMIKGRENENLINIDEVIKRAKNFGVDFGDGDPKNRLRYYTKIGLLPHAQRKSFSNGFPEGAYPEDVVESLIEIDREIKSGTSIQALKRKITERHEEEQKKEKFLSDTPFAIPSQIKTDYIQSSSLLSQNEFSKTEEILKPELNKKISFNIFSPFKEKYPAVFNFLKLAFVFLFFGAVVFFVGSKTNIVNLFPYFSASLDNIRKLAQSQPSSSVLSQENILASPLVEPYLTINAQTAISGSLSVKESVSSPAFIINQGNFGGSLSLSNLTADQNYNFPNQSGTICLSTGNCVGLAGEVFSTGGNSNRLAKFITSQRLGDSSINDLYSGTSVTIGPTGNVGIGIENPAYELHVGGEIWATGDICTDLGDGKCLSELTTATTTTTIIYSGGGGGGGLSGSGAANYLSIWTAGGALGESILYQSGGNVGIGTTTPSQKLDVFGTIRMLGFQLPTNATSGYILTSDALGFGTWQAPPTGAIPSGTAGQTLRNDGAGWLANSFLYNNGSAIGIGTTSALATLTVSGDEFLQGPLTISTSTFPQLVLKYDDNNYLRFSINASQTEILASKMMVINSLTGEIRLGADVNLLNATSATVWGETFISPDNDSTVRKSGELVLRSSTPIFRFPVPSQTSSTTFTRISKYFSGSMDFLPSALLGTTRRFAFLINFSDNIATSASSTWRVYRPGAAATTTTFYFAGQNLPSLEEGLAHLSNAISLPSDDWQLEVNMPPGNAVRIFNIFLLTYDQIN